MIVYTCVGTGVLDGPTAKRPLFRRTVEDAGPYKGTTIIT